MITEIVEIEVATVEVSDEYRVELRQQRRRTDYTPHQAEQLAAELIAGAASARQMLREHAAADSDRMRRTVGQVF